MRFLIAYSIFTIFLSTTMSGWMRDIESQMEIPGSYDRTNCCVSFLIQESITPSPDEPDQTLAIHLPYVQQNAPTTTATLSPQDPGYLAPLLETEEIPGTPTPTPIPTQTGEFNIPIVLGAVAIITIILFAWAIVGGSKH